MMRPKEDEMSDVVEQVRDLAERERALGRTGEAYDQLANHVESLRAALQETIGRLDQYTLGCQCPGMPCVTSCRECDQTQHLVNKSRDLLR